MTWKRSREDSARPLIGQEEAWRKTRAMQVASDMAHIEQGKMTRAEADGLYQRLGCTLKGRWAGAGPIKSAASRRPSAAKPAAVFDGTGGRRDGSCF